ncbi:hypothetical protein EBZ80_11430 [bacterium]|nr:hypothetical protein [bacterium]
MCRLHGLSPRIQYLLALGVPLNLTVLLRVLCEKHTKLDGYIVDIRTNNGYHTEAITLFSQPSLHLNSEGSHLLLTLTFH